MRVPVHCLDQLFLNCHAIAVIRKAQAVLPTEIVDVTLGQMSD
jgi:hypothetical protein